MLLDFNFQLPGTRTCVLNDYCNDLQDTIQLVLLRSLPCVCMRRGSLHCGRVSGANNRRGL